MLTPFPEIVTTGLDPVVHAETKFANTRWKALYSFAAAMTKEKNGKAERKNRKRNADRRKALLPCRAGTAAPP
jgi:hypothetical protein